MSVFFEGILMILYKLLEIQLLGPLRLYVKIWEQIFGLTISPFLTKIPLIGKMFTLSEGSKWYILKSQDTNYFKYLIHYPGGSPYSPAWHSYTDTWLKLLANSKAERDTSCGTSHPAAPGQWPGVPQPDFARSSALAHNAYRILCKYSAGIPGAFWILLEQSVHLALLWEGLVLPPISEGFPWGVGKD